MVQLYLGSSFALCKTALAMAQQHHFVFCCADWVAFVQISIVKRLREDIAPPRGYGGRGGGYDRGYDRGGGYGGGR